MPSTGPDEHQPATAPARPSAPGLITPHVLLVRNDADSADTVRHLAVLGGPAQRRAVLRPTPGTADQAVLGLDLLVALGKNPEMLRKERQLTSELWPLAEAWLAGLDIAVLVLDRAQTVPVDMVLDLTALASRGRAAWLWLIWSSRQHDPAALQTRLTDAGHRPVTVPAADLPRLLPAATSESAGAWPRVRPPRRIPAGLTLLQRQHLESRARAPVPAEPVWPALPAVDFTTFRAACARLLGRREFERVDALYQRTAAGVDEWLTEQRRLHAPKAPVGDLLYSGDLLDLVTPLNLNDIGEHLVHLLREQLAGTRPGAEALIRLRAIQAALFTSGILLRWDTQELGTDPVARLRGDLTPQVSASLMTMARTDHAALTALALHLNQGPHYFTCWSLADLTENGAVLHPPDRHQHNPPKWMTYPHYRAEHARRVGIAEIPCAAPIVIPEHARPIFAAHRAYRMDRTSPDGWQLFPAPRDAHLPRPATGALREAIIRTCERLNLDPPWMHRDPCRHGADRGVRPRLHGWLAERGLSVHQLDPVLVAHLHRRYRRYHPTSGSAGGQ